MKNFSSIVGWIILSAVIAIPAFLFYNWMSSKKTAEHQSQSKPVDATAIFKAPGGEAPKSIQSSSETAKPVSEPAAYKMAVSSSTSVPNTAVPAVKPAQAVSVSSPAAAAVGKSTFSVIIGTMSYFSPKSQRDPTLTPMDYAKIKEEEDRIREARLEKTRQTKKKKVTESPTAHMKLQGIVGTSAIINGEMVVLGQSYKGFKIIKVGSSYVIGVSNGKKYKLVMK